MKQTTEEDKTMKHAIQTQKTATLAICICLAAFTGLSVRCQTRESFIAQKVNAGYHQESSILFEALVSESPGYGQTESVNQVKSIVRQATVSRLLFDIHSNQSQGKEKAGDEFVRQDRLVKKFGLETGLDIYNGSICLGMTREMVYECLGEPSDVLVHDGAPSVRVEWDYSFYGICLCFEGDILSTIQRY